jgi:hypothetical protein
MPWNPMRVEQRIGRIDRLGQEHEVIRIVNLHYADTVEADIHAALRRRIGLFEWFVGRLQPILARLPRAIGAAVLGGTAGVERAGAELADRLAGRGIEEKATRPPGPVRSRPALSSTMPIPRAASCRTGTLTAWQS